jgi:hypothetical protein
MEEPMTNLPQRPRAGKPAPGPGNSPSWEDLVAFLAVLALGGALITLGQATVGTLAASFAILGALYGIWKRG